MDARKPEARLVRAGLVFLLDGRPVIALDRDCAILRTRTGATLAYRRPDPADAERRVRVPLWELPP